MEKVDLAGPPVDGTAKLNAMETFTAQLFLADEYVAQGLWGEAMELYQELSAMDPGNAEVKDKLNQVYAAYSQTGVDPAEAFEPTPGSDKVVALFDPQEMSDPINSKVS